ncbi:hypothetical protein, partial [Neisseria meningitidis]|uniref:hypothetical protein n=1 Tax=Neisseria meningitidis TaxID=487 RepID=UPI0019D32D0B
ERSYATAYWPFSVRESCTSNANPPLSENSEVLDSRLRGNDGGAVSAFPINDRNLKPILPTKTEKQKPKISSFSRKQLLRLPSKMPSERSSLQTAFFISNPYR